MTTTTKHTAGPWKVIASRVDAYTYYFGSDMSEANGLHMDQREANARLIAAAPELLAAAEDAVAELAKLPLHHLSGLSLSHSRLVKAIAKAVRP